MLSPPGHTAIYLLRECSLARTTWTNMCTLKAKSKGDRGLKAINNQMLSEPHSRKRMQLYEQDPGSRQTAVCFRSL